MPQQNPLPRLLIVNAAGGALIGLFCALGLLAVDAAQLRTLILRDPSGSMAFALLAAGFAIMAGGLCAATAVLGDANSDRGGSRHRTGRR